MVEVSRPDGVMVFRPWTVSRKLRGEESAHSVAAHSYHRMSSNWTDYYHRLYETFNKHSGLDEPDDRGNQPGTWECHLRSWFLNGLRPGIAQAVKGNYIEWKNGRLTAILAHALHAEEQQTMKKERARAKTDKELQPALVQAVSRLGGYLAPRNQQTRGGGGRKGRAEDPQAGLKETKFSARRRLLGCQSDRTGGPVVLSAS
ncbi:hypothetical protein M9458_051461 [Cirrhinus mrigala]|uniref:Uncharacterized protein n=1 Tax=Cirrhinus mrigala TaxID=683832 RepID=A0ABD0MVH3_CIRMR